MTDELSTEFMSVDEVAARLGLHPRTVRAYIRSGRLPATRIGKQYRVTPAGFTALTTHRVDTGADPGLAGGAVGALVVDGTAVVQIDGLTQRMADRLMTHLSATASSGGVRTDLITVPPVGRVKILVSGSLAAIIAYLTQIDHIVEALRAET